MSARHRKANALRRELHEASRASHDFSAALLINDPGLLPEEAAALRGLSEQAVVKPVIERVDPERGRVAVYVPRVSKESV